MKYVFDQEKKGTHTFLKPKKVLPMGKFKLNKSITKLSGTGSNGLSQLHAISSSLIQNSSSF